MPESIRSFAIRLSNAVGCYFDENVKSYSLKAFDSSTSGLRGVFAWVRAPIGTGPFSIAVHKNLAEEAKVMNLVDREKGSSYRERSQYPKESTPTVYFFVETNSEGEDFQRAVKALNAIMVLKKKLPGFD